MGRQATSRDVAGKQSRATVTLAAQIGDPAASSATKPHIVGLRRLLKEHCLGPYSDSVDEFAIVLRVPGRQVTWPWFIEGSSRVRRSIADRTITIDVGVPPTRWYGVLTSELRAHLSEVVHDALEMCVERLRRDGARVDDDALFRDYAVAASLYLS